MATVAKSFRVKLAAGHSIVEMRRFIVAHPQKVTIYFLKLINSN